MNKINSSPYGAEQIKTLEGIEAIRLRPGMYIGSTGLDGVRHITLEIISNVVDEYLNGHCTNCSIIVGGGVISVIDDGRGVPFGQAKDGSETLENIFTKLHTGAKFDSAGNAGYNTSGGMNGIGSKATNALSSFFVVESHRDGKIAKMRFEKGKRVDYVVTNDSHQTKTGTAIIFRPDEEIFKEGITLEYEPLKKQIQELAYLSPGLTFCLKYEDKPEESICSNNGILDYINDLNIKKETLTSVFYAENTEDRMGIKLAMQYNDSYSDTYKLYTNSIPNSGGTHLTGFRTALTAAINDYARNKKLLKEKEANLTGDELKEGLTLVLSFIMPDPVFSGQTKDVLTSSEARGAVQRLVTRELKEWLTSHPDDAKAIFEKAISARRAREAAKKAKDAVRVGQKKKKALKFDSKLADCSSKNRKGCEIVIVEGDSAAGNLKTARDNSYQAILPVRGKIINCLKAGLDKIQKNAEIMTMIDAFGLTVDPKTMKLTYKPEDLRYGKIIIESDADEDGNHIKNLFYTFIWTFCPQLIKDGYVYAGIPPLYKVTEGKDKFVYLKDDAALEEYRKRTSKKYVVKHLKGLGEMSVEETEILVNPDLRTIEQVTVEDADAATALFEDLMGTAIAPRKEFLQKHSL